MSHYNWPLRTSALANKAVTVAKMAPGTNLQVLQTSGSAVGWTTNLSLGGTLTVASTVTVTAGGLTVSAGGANITGGLTVATGGLVVSASGINVTGASAFSTTVTGGTYNGQTISSAASFTGSLAVATSCTVGNGLTVTAGGLVVSAGGANITGTVTTSSTINSQTISATASFTGTVTVATGLTVTAGGLTVTAGGLTVSAGTSALQAITGTTLTLSSSFSAASFNATGTGAIYTNATAGTSAAYHQFVNTGGNYYIGADSSTASVFGSGNYSMTIWSATNLAIKTGGGTLAMNLSSTQIATIPTALEIGSALGSAYPSSGTVRLAQNSTTTVVLKVNNTIATTDQTILSFGATDVRIGIDMNPLNATTTILSNGGLVPSFNGTIPLGTTGLRWSQVWCTAGAFNTSHSSVKRQMHRMSPASLLSLARETAIYAYRYSTGNADADRPVHLGFKAEDTRRLLSIDGQSSAPGSTAAAALGAVVGLEDSLRAEISRLSERLSALEASGRA